MYLPEFYEEILDTKKFSKRPSTLPSRNLYRTLFQTYGSKRVYSRVNYIFLKVKRPDIFPGTSECFPCRKKFPKFGKIVRNIFRGIFLHRTFPQGNFPVLVEIKTRLKPWIYTFKICNILINSVVLILAGQKNFRKGFWKFPETLRLLLYKNI